MFGPKLHGEKRLPDHPIGFFPQLLAEPARCRQPIQAMPVLEPTRPEHMQAHPQPIQGFERRKPQQLQRTSKRMQLATVKEGHAGLFPGDAQTECLRQPQQVHIWLADEVVEALQRDPWLQLQRAGQPSELRGLLKHHRL